MLDEIDDLRNLVDGSATIVGPGTPLVAIDRAKVASHGVGPLVPDTYTMLLKIAHIGVALQEPEQFVDDGLQMELLRREQWEALRKVKAHLMTEDTECACTGTVGLLHPL